MNYIGMSANPQTIRDIYVVGLRNQHAVEHQAIELLERQVGRLENYPEMADRMRRHIEESKLQMQRIEELLDGLGTSRSALKDMAMATLGNLMAIGHAPAPDEVIKNSFANFAFEHYEIASYQALLTMAEAAGHTAGASPLQVSLQEEQAMARWLADHLKPTTLRFLERSAAGEKAGL
jgi:ferritin-like metal-binding protein YciE